MIELIYNNGFKWFGSGNIRVKGAFFDDKGTFYHEESMPGFFENVNTFSSFISLLKKCNGVFSVIIRSDDELWAAVDRNISFPLFYVKNAKNIALSDDANLLTKYIDNIKVDKLQRSVYRNFGHTLEDKTLVENIYEIECAQAISIRKNSATVKSFYYTFSSEYLNNVTDEEVFNTGYELFEKTIERLIKSLNGRTAVIPLSGGYDSRWIVTALKKHNYKNVICYTYGKLENNPEWRISKKVAEQHGYPWFLVEYNNKLFADFVKTEVFRKYINYTAHLSSTFFLQEYFAVKYLKENDLIPADSVFIPGHSGDLIGGSQLIKVFDKNLTSEDINELFIKKKSIYGSLSDREKEQVKELIKDRVLIVGNNIPTTIFEEIDIREKISKIIFNSSLVYDFFGYEKRFPFWDVELLNYFLGLSFERREMKKLYDRILIEKYFKPLNVFFEEELQPTRAQLIVQNIKNRIKPFLPSFVKFKLLKRSDWINYQVATGMLVDDLKSKNIKMYLNGNSYNEVLIEYYLLTLKNNFIKR